MKQQMTVPFELQQSGLILVGATVNGRDLRFVVDTGASHTVLTSRAAAELGLDTAGAGSGPAMGAGGAVAARPVTVRSFVWGDADLSNLTLMQIGMDEVCGLTGADVAGIIGYDVLSRFRFTVDYQARQMLLEPVSGDGGARIP